MNDGYALNLKHDGALGVKLFFILLLLEDMWAQEILNFFAERKAAAQASW